MAGRPKTRASALILAVEWVAAAAYVFAVYFTIYDVVVGVAIRFWPDLAGNPVLLLCIGAAAICGSGLGRLRSGVRSLAGRVWPSAAAEPHSMLADAITRSAAAPSVADALSRLAGLVAAGTSARRVDVWVARDDGFRLTASSPAGSVRRPAGPAVSLDELALIAGIDHVIAIAESGQVLGALAIAAPQGRSLASRDLRLAANMANAAGLLMRTLYLDNRLCERIRVEAEQAAVLDASRRRLIAARDAAREQLRREIQAEVCTALEWCSGSLRGLVDRLDDHAAMADAVAAMSGEVDDAIGRFRRLVHGVYPATLTDHGLVPALDNLTADLRLRASVSAPALPRFPTPVEACAYFCLSSLLRAWPHACDEDRIRIALRVEGADLVAVVSDGAVRDTAASRAEVPLGRSSPQVFHPLVLESARHRVAALDGSLSVESAGPANAVIMRIPALHVELISECVPLSARRAFLEPRLDVPCAPRVDRRGLRVRRGPHRRPARPVVGLALGAPGPGG